MAVKSKSFNSSHVSATGVRGKKTSQGRGNVGYSTMNKNRKANYKKYRGQGKWVKDYILQMNYIR